MDVSCPQCKTEYEFEDARIPDDGLTVKCTQCAHVFRMKKRPSDLPRPTDDSMPGRDWRLRQASGNVFSFRRLTTLQKWIVERKVQKDDEISLTGDSWKRLGDIAELASFFQVVDDALKAEARASAPPPPPQQQPPPPPPPPAPPQAQQRSPDATGIIPPPTQATSKPLIDTLPGPGFGPLPPLPPSAGPQGPTKVGNETVRGNIFSLPPPSNPGPPLQSAPKRVPTGNTGVRSAYRPDEKSAGGGGLLVWFAIGLVILGLGGAGAWYVFVWMPEQEILEAERAEAAKQSEIERSSQEALAAQRKVAEDAAKARAAAEAAKSDAGAAAKPDAGAVAVVPAVVDAGTSRGAAVVDAGSEPAAPPKPKSYDQLMAEAERLRARDKATAALALFAKAAEMKPNRVEPQAGGGFALLDLGKMADAEQAFKAALQVNPRYGPALIGMAEASKGLGKKAQAIEHYEKYLEVLPNGSEAKMAAGAIARLKE